MEKLLVKRLGSNGILPIRCTEGAAGYDLFSACDITVPAGGRVLVPTDIGIVLPPGTYGRIAPRSGLALKYGMDIGGGVIDLDYRGPLGVIMFNFNSLDYEVAKGERIAQLIIQRIATPEVVEVSDLYATMRGLSGFGSTGTGVSYSVLEDSRVPSFIPTIHFS